MRALMLMGRFAGQIILVAESFAIQGVNDGWCREAAAMTYPYNSTGTVYNRAYPTLPASYIAWADAGFPATGGEIIRPPLPTPVTLESYDGPLSNFTISQGDPGAIDTVNKVQGAGSLRLRGMGVAAQTPQAVRTSGVLDPNSFGTIAVWMKYFSELQGNSARLQFGRNAAAFLDVITATAGGNGQGSFWAAAHASEIAGLLAMGPGTFDYKLRVFQNAPHANDWAIDALKLNAGGQCGFGFRFDDTHDTTFTIAEPYLRPMGFKGDVYVVLEGPVGINTAGHLTTGMLQSLASKGWNIGVDSPDDGPYTQYADTAAAVAAMRRIQAFLDANQMPEGRNGGVWPGTTTSIIPTSTQVAAMTSDGSATVILGAATTIVAGHTCDAYGVPPGVTVLVGGTNVTSVLLSQPIPARAARAARFVDKSGPFYPGKLPDAMRDAGMMYFQGGGGSGFFANGDFYDRYGIGGQEMNLPALSVGTQPVATVKAVMDLAKARGTYLTLLFHRLGGVGGFDTPVANFQQLADYAYQLEQAGQSKQRHLRQRYLDFSANPISP